MEVVSYLIFNVFVHLYLRRIECLAELFFARGRLLKWFLMLIKHSFNGFFFIFLILIIHVKMRRSLIKLGLLDFGCRIFKFLFNSLLLNVIWFVFNVFLFNFILLINFLNIRRLLFLSVNFKIYAIILS